MRHAFYAEYSGLPSGRKSLGITSAMQKEYNESLTDYTDDNWSHGNAGRMSPRIFVSTAEGSQTKSLPLFEEDEEAEEEDDTACSESTSGTRHVTRLSLNSVQDTVVPSGSDMDTPAGLPEMHPTSTVPFLSPLDNSTHETAPLVADSHFIRAIAKSNNKRRGSIGELRRQKTISAPVAPRQTKSSIQAFGKKSHRSSVVDRSTVHWDPHIDSFDLLRAKITGITRTMQDFHVQELFRDELSTRNLKRERHHSTAGYLTTSSSTLHTDDLFTHKHKGHRRTQSYSTSQLSPALPPPPSIKSPSHLHTSFEHDSLHDTHNDCERVDQDDSGGVPSDSDHESDPETAEIPPHFRPASPNLNSLFVTTNALIQSRFEELSETASIASSCDVGLADLAADAEANTTESPSWRSQFLGLVSSCITQSEELESLSTELLGTELKVRELSVLNDTVEEQFTEREKAYEERLRECKDVAKQQLLMIDTLNELLADLDMKLDQINRRKQATTAAESSKGSGQATDQASDEEPEPSRWDFAQAVADILNIESKDDVVHRLRWEVGMFVGGGVGTGHIIHTFEGQLHGIEMMIAGSGTTVVEEDKDAPSQQQAGAAEVRRGMHLTHVSPTIRHATFHRHHYLLHLLPKDRQTRFRMLPQAHWVPDQLADQCQFEGTRRCSLRFSLLQRRHHCRRCGKVVCQLHSGNRLPLFKTASSPAEWCRVCDQCFCDLITTQS